MATTTKPAKEYTLLQSHTRRGERLVSGTIEYLSTSYYGYTLECGASYNRKINRQPTTIKSLISNLNKAFNEKEASCYERTFISLATDEDIARVKAAEVAKLGRAVSDATMI